ncbi:MauE/DoxX family redox-associated membrane protein [Microvirga massiliensis]|uniref:MauE/DoxX family redox-associated membrane protein n=1 Tax=Microvirga massiliensis TaxID=1033741 RepID=UPI00062B5D67|nr:MauE/DoxX family redox-associated membrane protein [Microvirga massiliensis]
MSVWDEPLVAIFARSFLAFLFAAAAVSKLRQREEFFGVVRNFRMMPEALARPVAAILPWVELAVAAGLAVGITAPYAAFTAGGLLVLFGIAIGVNVLRGRRAIDCGCFRMGMKQSLSWMLVGRNAVLASAAFWLAYTLPLVRPANIAELAIGIIAASFALLLYFSATYLSALSSASRTDNSLFSQG